MMTITINDDDKLDCGMFCRAWLPINYLVKYLFLDEGSVFELAMTTGVGNVIPDDTRGVAQINSNVPSLHQGRKSVLSPSVCPTADNLSERTGNSTPKGPSEQTQSTNESNTWPVPEDYIKVELI